MVVPTTLLLVPKDHGRHHYFIVHQTHSLQKRERRDPVRKRNGTSKEKGCFNRINPSMSFRAHRPAPKGNHSFASGRLYLGIARKARPALLLAERSHRVERPSFLASTNVGLLRKSIGQARLTGPGAGDNAGDAPNPPDDGAAGQGPPDAGQPNPGGGGGGGGGFVRPGIGTQPPHRMDSVFAACMFSKEAADMAIHVYNVSNGDILATSGRLTVNLSAPQSSGLTTCIKGAVGSR